MFPFGDHEAGDVIQTSDELMRLHYFGPVRCRGLGQFGEELASGKRIRMRTPFLRVPPRGEVSGVQVGPQVAAGLGQRVAPATLVAERRIICDGGDCLVDSGLDIVIY